jgi:hypothetical protein
MRNLGMVCEGTFEVLSKTNTVFISAGDGSAEKRTY